MTKPAAVDENRKPRGKRPAARHQVMAAINVRIPRDMFEWLNGQAAEHGTTVSEEVRNAVASVMTGGLPIRQVMEDKS